MDVYGIQEFVQKYNIEERSFLGFWSYFNNYRKSYSDEFDNQFPEFDEKKVDLYVDSVAFRISNWPEDGYNHVIVTVRIFYKDTPTGIYEMVFNLTGEVEDDHLSI